MSCVYCCGDRNLIECVDRLSTKGDFHPGIIASIYENTITIQAVADTYEPNFMEEDIKINFCPMCGKDLTE